MGIMLEIIETWDEASMGQHKAHEKRHQRKAYEPHHKPIMFNDHSLKRKLRKQKASDILVRCLPESKL